MKMHTMRIGTSLLYKCRLIPEIWAWISEQLPELKIKILPMTEYQNRGNAFSMLGIKYDMCGYLWDRQLEGYLPVFRTCSHPRLLCGGKNHRFAKIEKLTLQDLNGEYLVMPIEGVSEELDAFRSEIRQNHPTIQIIDSAYYGVDTFTMCEVNPYILITQPVYSNIHTNFVTIPLKTEYTLPD